MKPAARDNRAVASEHPSDEGPSAASLQVVERASMVMRGENRRAFGDDAPAPDIDILAPVVSY